MARLLLIDSFNFIFRAYHARARSSAAPMKTSRGASTEAIYIFHNMLRRLVRQYRPDYLAAVFECEGPTFRHQQFAAYKATRDETPPELIDQIPAIERMLGAMRIPVLKSAGYEADDVIGTVARREAARGAEVWVVSSDKDMLQLVGDGVWMLDAMKNDLLYDPSKVKEFKGVEPAQIADLLALVGDTSDNIPGAPGIGDKGAVQLLEQFGSVEALLDRAAEVQRKAYRESLQNNREQVELSKRLATIACDAPLEYDLESLRCTAPDRDALASFYREFEFISFLKELGVDAAPEASPAPPAGDGPETIDDHSPAPTAAEVRVMAFLVLADPGACQIDSLTARYLERPPATEEETLRALRRKLSPLLTGDLRRIYDEIDRPLLAVLERMERLGIRIEVEQLAALSARMEKDIAGLTEEIYALAGGPFNLNSPKQLGEVLFERLKLPSMGKTGKTKAFSTAADVLEALAENYPIAGRILEYRQLAKLKGTYVDALPGLIGEDGRLHTTFNPTGAATGRLSSINPNLQNIPVRTELGREIRAAFVPEPGWTMLVADYSQIELRLLAHYSGDAVLVEAFRNGEDIHTRTASEVNGVPPLMVTPEMRRAAKAVNFGIVYGQTAFGLAAQLGIPREEADRYIREYFTRYAGVKRWIEATVEEVRARGYTLTLDGRRRPIPDIDAKNPNLRGFAERTAVNTPLQGTAADLIKKAMIRLQAALEAQHLKSRMLLQVHDELVFECPPEELAVVSRLVKTTMEGVAQLKVPLLADCGTGANWRDAK